MIIISDYLSKGANNAITAGKLCELLHMDKRALTAGIERERRQGSPICASCDGQNPGYYLADSKQEMQMYCDSLFHRAAEIYKTRDACLLTIDNLPGKELAAHEQKESNQQ